MRNCIEMTNIDADFFMNQFLEEDHCKNQNLWSIFEIAYLGLGTSHCKQIKNILLPIAEHSYFM